MNAEPSGRRYALLIGTARYDGNDLPDLPAVEHDVQRIKALLDDRGEFDDVIELLDPVRGQATEALERFFGGLAFGDTALLYYSGHGVTDPAGSALFLTTRDSRLDRLHTSAVDASGLIGHLLGTTAAAEKVVLLDCCSSGLFRAQDRLRPAVRAEPRKQFRPRGTFVLTATSSRRQTFASSPDGPSDFTAVVLRALGGQAATRENSGWITTHDLSDHVHAATAANERLTPAESSEGVVAPIRLVRASPEQVRRRGVRQATGRREAPLDVDRWRCLLRYFRDSITRENNLKSYLPIRLGPQHHLLPGRESVLSAPGTPLLEGLTLPVSDGGNSGSEICYGYPLVVVRGPDRTLRLAPLLTCTIRIGPDGVPDADLPPRPHVALAADRGLSDNEYRDLVQEVEGRFASGGPDELTTAAELVRKVLGLSLLTPLDPAALNTSLETVGAVDTVQNAALLWTADSTDKATAGLLKDLTEIGTRLSDIERTALGALVRRTASDRPAPAETVTLVAGEPLNEAQERVVRAAMIDPLTVVQGPPGTGKSQLITALLATASAVGQNVLIASTNNQAVNTVVDKVKALGANGLVVRTGNALARASERELVGELLGSLSQPTAPADLETDLAKLRILGSQASKLTAELDEVAALECELQGLVPDVLRARELPSALPSGETELRVVLRRLERAGLWGPFGWFARRGIRRRFGVAEAGQREELADLVCSLIRFAVDSTRIAQLSSPEQSWARLQELRVKDRPEVSRRLLLGQQAERLRRGEPALRRRWDCLSRNANPWQGLTRDLWAALPGWAVTTLSARTVFPPNAELFDLVVIDEAAQCSIPAVLPLLYRAKRALVIGDPRQLAPVITLRSAEDTALQAAAGLSSEWVEQRRLSYATDTAYDAFAAAAADVHMLDEHYRCHPEIVAVPAREVYHGRLTVLTDVTRLRLRADEPVRWVDAPGRFVAGETGSGSNPDEAAAVVTVVKELRTQYPEATIGVISPLAPQVREMKSLLGRAALSEPGAEEVIRCGSVHSFQGDERDIIVLSPAGASGIGSRTRTWLCDQLELWNVAITRARAALVVVGDRSWWRTQHGLLAGMAAGATGGQHRRATVLDAADRLHAELERRGATVRRGTERDGRYYDLMVSVGGGPVVAVVLDDTGADPSGRRLRRVLGEVNAVRSGLRVVRTPLWQSLLDPQRCAEYLLELTTS